ncbi:MAG: hypothetical protein ACLU4N_08460 [Butyricimonas faecihominis]
MYAEDEAETREVYRDNLVAMGYDVCAVEDGDQAVESTSMRISICCCWMWFYPVSKETKF